MPSPYLINISVGSRFIVNRKSARQTAIESFKKHGVQSAWIDVSIVGQRKMKQLNKLREKDGPTNVLSFTQRDPTEGKQFPTPDGVIPHFGDIVLCYPVLIQEAAKKNKLVDDLINYYIDHSIYHLMGKHYQEDDDLVESRESSPHFTKVTRGMAGVRRE